MTIDQYIDSRLELLNMAIKMEDVNWTTELKNTLGNLAEAKEFIARKRKEYSK